MDTGVGGKSRRHNFGGGLCEGSRHYCPILNLRAAAGSKGYCIPCNLPYRPERGVHRCSHKCLRCRGVPSCKTEKVELIQCKQCKGMFYGRECFERHRAEKSYGDGRVSVCSALQFCDDCGRLYRTASARHECGVVFCNICSLRQDDETLKDTASVKIHVPTLCVAQQICVACAGEDDMTVCCRWCGVREFVFRDDPVRQFVDFVTRTTKCFKQIICIAHNAKAFDAQFILRYITEKRGDLDPQVILNGTKIVVLTAGRTKFIDSINYMPMRLSALPQTFGLRGRVEKGYFPHLFNTLANQSYVGPLPAVECYSPDSMSSKERERFLSWHAEQMRKDAVFDFQREIVRYCRNDVDILRRASIAFRKIFLERGNVCPFEECTTIASTCMRFFRKNFLREEEIGVIPRDGYRLADTQSRKALQWLVWKERELGRIIVHTGHGREHRLVEVGGIPVDGCYETANGERHVLQYHGCFWHGCPVCFTTERDKRLCTGKREVYDTMNSQYERTLTTSWRLRKRGYIVTEKWEYAFDRNTRENREMRAFLDHYPMLAAKPLSPRDAFFGGQTGNIAIWREVTGTEKIRYVDVCFLYPYVLKTGAFPIGHPKILVGQKECASLIGAMPGVDISAVEGLVRCRVLPPRNLFHPVLPYRVQGKLLFALCRSCCENFSQTQCLHENPRDREFESQEESGWPSKCVDDQSKERYLREYKAVEGKFGQRLNLTSTEVVKSQERLVSLLSSPEHEVTDILPVSDEVIYVSWRMRDEAVPSPITNVIAAYTTAQARLKLHEYLERLGKRVFYYNTDSCIYVSSGEPGKYEPRTGNFLGDMTDELKGYGRDLSVAETTAVTGREREEEEDEEMRELFHDAKEPMDALPQTSSVLPKHYSTPFPDGTGHLWDVH
ncbi:uncharacterized protein LOC109862847, partial [Pseudomyrmex gracilis]|uniref:uncharacterized protein LOC109862847 n=1 Tax=Pseudomyrmex gracilis TaxID=219809 RepID=UPI0009951D3B